MSKGNQIIPVRFSPVEVTMIDAAIARVNRKTKDEPLDRSSFVRRAVKEAVAHMERGKRKRASRNVIYQG